MLPRHAIFIFAAAAALAGCTGLKVQKTDTSHMVMSGMAIDSATYRTIGPYKRSLDAKMNEVIGFAPQPLVKASPENPLGNFFSDIMLAKARRLGMSDTSHTLAIFNNGGLRTNVPQGDVTVRTMFELMPFENELVLMQMKGGDLWRVLDGVAGKGGAPVSGLRFAIGKQKAYDVRVNGVPLDTNKIYTVVTSDYLANGGDKLFAGGKALPFTRTDLLLRDILIEYCREQNKLKKPLTAQTDGRISTAE